MPLVSVIMPAYNAEKFIAASIESVLNQTFFDFELIIINDGSSDNTLDIAQQFALKDKRIIIISQENQGETAARNTGLAHAKGEYVAFLDSDDLYKETFLEKMVNRLESGDCEAVYCGFINQKTDKGQGEPFAEGNILEIYTTHHQHIWIVCFMVKKSYLDQHNIRFTPGVTMGGDQEFIGLCGLYCRVKAVPEFLAIYQYNPDSMSNTLSFKKRKEDILARNRVLEQITLKFNSPIKKEVISYFAKLIDEFKYAAKKTVWSEIKKGNFDFAILAINEFGHFENVARNRKLPEQLQTSIINSKNILLWKLIWRLKVLELIITGKYHSNKP
jgi:glycosyltransferase involved in cell wall biosynthesis